MKTLLKNCPTHGLTTWMVIQTFYEGLNFTSRNLLDSAAGGTFMSNTLGAATKLLDEMMLNYSQWHTKRAPTGKKVSSVEEISYLNEKVDLIMSLLTKQPSIDPQDVPLNSLVAQEQLDVNFVSRNNFNNNAYRSNFGSNNPRPFPSNNYGNNTYPTTSNSYSQNYRERDLPSYEKLVEIEKSTKSYMHTQFEQNKAFSRQLDEHSSILQNISKQLVSLNGDISSLQTRLTAIETYVSNMSHTQSTLINQMAAKPEVIPKEEERITSLPTYLTLATIEVVEDLQTVSTHHTPTPTRPINGEATPSTLEEETSMNIEAFKQVSLNDITTSLVDNSDLDFDNCTLPEVIGFLHKMSRDPHTSTLNLAFTEHITNALIKVREEKLRLEASIPRKLEDGWDPMIKIKLNVLLFVMLEQVPLLCPK